MHSLCVPLPKKAIIPNAYIRIPSILCFIHVPAKYVFSSVLRIELANFLKESYTLVTN